MPDNSPKRYTTVFRPPLGRGEIQHLTLEELDQVFLIIANSTTNLTAGNLRYQFSEFGYVVGSYQGVHGRVRVTVFSD